MIRNIHTPRVGDGVLECEAPGCGLAMYVGKHTTDTARAQASPADYLGFIWDRHARQFGPGAAPDITVEWELVATCSVCPEGGDMRTGDDNTVVCDVCGTWWDHDGTGGETDEDKLEEILERDHEEALDHAAWLIAGRDRAGKIRMHGGRSTHVADADNSRAEIEAWLARSRPGRFRDMYRAALELLDREAVERTREVALEREVSGEAMTDVQRLGRAAAAAEDKRLREGGK